MSEGKTEIFYGGLAQLFGKPVNKFQLIWSYLVAMTTYFPTMGQKRICGKESPFLGQTAKIILDP